MKMDTIMRAGKRARAGLIGAFLAAVAVAGPEPAVPAPTEWTVSAAFYGTSGGRNPGLADTFLERLPLGRDLRAKRAPFCAWLSVPAGAVPGTHVNVLELRFGQRLELLALVPGPGGSNLIWASRATALSGQEGKYYQSYMAPPGDFQLPDNAPADLVNIFADRGAHPPVMKGPVTLTLIRLEPGAPEALTGNEMRSASPFLDPLEPLAAAALAEDGYQPVFQSGAVTIVLGLGTGADGASHDVRAVLAKEGKKLAQVERIGIRPERLYDSLRLVFLQLLEWRDVVSEAGHSDESETNVVAAEVAPVPDSDRKRLTQAWPRPLQGGFYAVAGGFMGCDEAGTLYNTGGDGRILWTAGIGGGLVGEPQVEGDAILAGSQSNAVYLLDKAAGTVRAVRTFPIWVRAVRLAGGRVYCLDLKNRLSILDARTLATEKEISFPFPMKPRIDADPASSGILLMDEKGFFYRCRLEGKRGGS